MIGNIRQILQVGHDDIDFPGYCSRNDSREIIDLKGEFRTQPGGKAVGQLNVIPVQRSAFIVAVRRHGGGGADGQTDVGLVGNRNIRHFVILFQHPAPKHVIECSVCTDFGNKAIDLIFKIGYPGGGGYSHHNLNRVSQGFLKQMYACLTVVNG